MLVVVGGLTLTFWFKSPLLQVVISRLPVGHTHEDIDQKFSVISRVSRALCHDFPRVVSPRLVISTPFRTYLPVSQRLKGEDVITPQEFEQTVRGAFLDIKRDSNANVCMV